MTKNSNFFTGVVALLLVPCLIADPVLASAMRPAATGRPGSADRVFASQAFAAPFVAAEANFAVHSRATVMQRAENAGRTPNGTGQASPSGLQSAIERGDLEAAEREIAALHSNPRTWAQLNDALPDLNDLLDARDASAERRAGIWINVASQMALPPGTDELRIRWLALGRTLFYLMDVYERDHKPSEAIAVGVQSKTFLTRFAEDLITIPPDLTSVMVSLYCDLAKMRRVKLMIDFSREDLRAAIRDIQTGIKLLPGSNVDDFDKGGVLIVGALLLTDGAAFEPANRRESMHSEAANLLAAAATLLGEVAQRADLEDPHRENADLQQNLNHFASHMQYGIAYLAAHQHKWNYVMENLESSLRMDPDYEPAMALMALAELHLGHFDNALAWANRTDGSSPMTQAAALETFVARAQDVAETDPAEARRLYHEAAGMWSTPTETLLAQYRMLGLLPELLQCAVELELAVGNLDEAMRSADLLLKEQAPDAALARRLAAQAEWAGVRDPWIESLERDGADRSMALAALIRDVPPGSQNLSHGILSLGDMQTQVRLVLRQAVSENPIRGLMHLNSLIDQHSSLMACPFLSIILEQIDPLLDRPGISFEQKIAFAEKLWVLSQAQQSKSPQMALMNMAAASLKLGKLYDTEPSHRDTPRALDYLRRARNELLSGRPTTGAEPWEPAFWHTISIHIHFSRDRALDNRWQSMQGSESDVIEAGKVFEALRQALSVAGDAATPLLRARALALEAMQWCKMAFYHADRKSEWHAKADRLSTDSLRIAEDDASAKPHSLYSRALVALQMERLEEAEGIILSLTPTLLLNWALGRIYYLTGRYADHEELFTQRLPSGATPSAGYDMGRSYVRRAEALPDPERAPLYAQALDAWRPIFNPGAPIGVLIAMGEWGDLLTQFLNVSLILQRSDDISLAFDRIFHYGLNDERLPAQLAAGVREEYAHRLQQRQADSWAQSLSTLLTGANASKSQLKNWLGNNDWKNLPPDIQTCTLATGLRVAPPPLVGPLLDETARLFRRELSPSTLNQLALALAVLSNPAEAERIAVMIGQIREKLNVVEQQELLRGYQALEQELTELEAAASGTLMHPEKGEGGRDRIWAIAEEHALEAMEEGTDPTVLAKTADNRQSLVAHAEVLASFIGWQTYETGYVHILTMCAQMERAIAAGERTRPLLNALQSALDEINRRASTFLRLDQDTTSLRTAFRDKITDFERLVHNVERAETQRLEAIRSQRHLWQPLLARIVGTERAGSPELSEFMDHLPSWDEDQIQEHFADVERPEDMAAVLLYTLWATLPGEANSEERWNAYRPYFHLLAGELPIIRLLSEMPLTIEFTNPLKLNLSIPAELDKLGALLLGNDVPGYAEWGPNSEETYVLSRQLAKAIALRATPRFDGGRWIYGDLVRELTNPDSELRYVPDPNNVKQKQLMLALGNKTHSMRLRVQIVDRKTWPAEIRQSTGGTILLQETPEQYVLFILWQPEHGSTGNAAAKPILERIERTAREVALRRLGHIPMHAYALAGLDEQNNVSHSEYAISPPEQDQLHLFHEFVEARDQQRKDLAQIAWDFALVADGAYFEDLFQSLIAALLFQNSEYARIQEGRDQLLDEGQSRSRAKFIQAYRGAIGHEDPTERVAVINILFGDLVDLVARPLIKGILDRLPWGVTAEEAAYAVLSRESRAMEGRLFPRRRRKPFQEAS